jgi:hypothetical protein
MDVDALISRYPTLYHMAEKDSWPSIKAIGLLSTTAVLDRFNVSGPQRLALEENHRLEKVGVGPAGSQIILRDQKPMRPSRLEEALVDGTTPREWYKFLNGRVFMWAKEERLLGLLHAQHYRNLEHDVLTIDTQALMARYHGRVWLCRLNSGNTLPVPHPRSMDDFKRITDYPTKPSSGAPMKEVVEVVVDYSIPDVAEYVLEVRRMRGSTVLGFIPL